MYDNRIEEEKEVRPTGGESLSAKMDKANKMAEDAMQIANKIYIHMFDGKKTETNDVSPSCFNEALDKQCAILLFLNETLMCLADRLGC